MSLCDGLGVGHPANDVEACGSDVLQDTPGGGSGRSQASALLALHRHQLASPARERAGCSACAGYSRRPPQNA